MFDHQLSFNYPWYLTLLALLPVLWWFSLRSLALLGRVRKWVAIALRSLMVILVILALAEIQMVRVHDKLTVIYLLDQSASIPEEKRRAMIDYVNTVIGKHRQHEDRVGVIVFGREAAIEIPPIDDDVAMAAGIESPLDPEYTSLARAMKLAQATFPEDAAGRIVLISDGNQNLGNVNEQAQGASGAGIGIDVLPIHYQARTEVTVERLIIPSDVRREEPFDMKVVLSNSARATAESSGEVRGRLQVSRLGGGEPHIISNEAVVLKPGKTVLGIPPTTIKAPNFYTYEARFIPDRPEDDAMPQNNRATAFTHVRGKGRVLLIEDYEHQGEFRQLAERLKDNGLEVVVQASNQLFSSPGDLLQYDTVILANVPRTTGGVDKVYHFSDDQIRMLVRNTQQMGAGLVMLGGPNSFGAGGWANTELEKAMPVDFQIKSAKAVARGALVMVMHACEIPQGNFWQKVIAKEAIKSLGAQDYCGVLFWGARGDQWMWGKGLLSVGGNRDKMMAAIDRMTPGDMPQFDPTMKMALQGFNKVPDAAAKHMIIISDGDPSFANRRLVNALSSAGVTISTVAVGAHGPAGSSLLASIARGGNGKYYKVRNPKALPRIFQREARRVARPLLHKNENGFGPYVNVPHEMISGFDPSEPLPDIKGYVMTSRKENPLVEVVLLAPEPTGKATERERTILASWTYGLGKAVAFTSDAGARWTDGWLSEPMYDKLFSQIIRYSMRPSGNPGDFTVATEIEGQRVRLVVTALNKEEEFLNFLNMSASAAGPEGKQIPIEMEQTAPGRYTGSFSANQAGSYFVVINHGMQHLAPIFTGINMPYSEEFRHQTTNDALLDQLAQMVPEGGKPGIVIIDATQDAPLGEGLMAGKEFRHGELAKATSSRDIWHYVMLVGSCLFFFDVFFRRVQVSLTWVPPLLGRLRDTILRREPQPAVVETMQRLRKSKAEVTDQIKQLHADARFEPSAEVDLDADVFEEPIGPKPAARSISGVEPTDEESYTERLLRAKKKAWDERNRTD